jgi:hypothetical protein
MFYEIAVDANQFIEQSLIGKDQVTRNALRPIKRMRDKLDGLGFLDYRVAPVVTTIDNLLTRIPDRGAIEGPILQEILATAMLLADPDKTRRHGQGLLAGHSLVVEDELPENVLAPSSLTMAADNGVDEVAQFNPANVLISGLFDGIFEADDQSESEPEAVTTEDDNEEDEGSNPDYWF